ncbi:MAG: acetolactate synthase [Betaproteobacteria bacterium RIFCSPLOWO2_12_FULL_62_58]|nr:MAG: acetolactate synthase [Betaproteobacteria bacterium RIFCSPLOWO2_12_FULL_62_58]
MIRVSDYLAKRVAEMGVRHVFMISGGGAMHLNDAFGKHEDLQYICNHHEQACAIAAEGYARISGNIGVAVVTSGPGSTNTITGVLGMWLDSIPGLIISGNVRYATTVESTGLPLRQLGDQEANIIAIVRSVTKYAVMVKDPSSIRYHFEKAVYLAKHGRPGPVWLDIPLDVQAAKVEESSLPGYSPVEDEIRFEPDAIRKHALEIIDRIRSSERPLLLAGNGIRLSGGLDAFYEAVDRLNIPVQTAMGANDLIHSDHPLFFGRPSVTGDRSSNFIVQNCDLLLSIGARQGVRTISYLFEAFARDAYKIHVDIDEAELKKPTVFPDQRIHCDAKLLLEEIVSQLRPSELEPKANWIEWCRERRHRYPSVIPEYRAQKEFVNSFHFVEVLSQLAAPNDIFVLADGAANTCTFQAVSLKHGQRLFTNSGCASMGYDLPAAIGACFAGNRGRILCVAGDGSIQLNIQELQTIVHHRLPIKIFLWNNRGYASIRMTQDAYFPGGYVAADPSSGVSFPDMAKIAQAYGLPALRVHDHTILRESIQATLDSPGPVLCEIIMAPDQPLLPKLASELKPDGTMVSKPLEDMFPFLSRNEFMENMLIKPWETST